MEEYYLNAGLQPTLQFEPSPMSSAWPTPSLLSSTPELNCSSEQSSDCFLNSNWEKSTDQYSQFESALSSMVSSPAASNSAMSNNSFAIRELIGKLGTVFNSGEISPTLLAAKSYVGGGNNSTTTSCYSTPLNSPVKMPMPIVDQLPTLANSMPLNNSPLPALSTDPGFAERAAKFFCFGSRSFNGRTGPLRLNNNELPHRSSTPLMDGGKLSRVSSSRSLNVVGSPTKNIKSSHAQMGMRPANSNEESSVSEQNPIGEKGPKAPGELNSRKRKASSRGKAKEDASFQSGNTKKGVEVGKNTNAKRSRPTECDDQIENGTVNTEEERKGNTNDAGDEGQKQTKANQKPPEPPKDYIHVRARRGQATDSHSLAERVRREKISQRMKRLQDLVPGCNKVTGKALMLDEIINYVQSMQRQVEFLSIKLASINPKMDFKKDGLLSKDIFQPNGPLPHPVYPLDSSVPALYGHHQQQSPQVHTNISDGAVSQCPLDPLDTTLSCNISMQLPPLNGFGEGLPQLPPFCEDDLQNIVHMGFSHNPNEELHFIRKSFPVTNQTSHMKVDP